MIGEFQGAMLNSPEPTQNPVTETHDSHGLTHKRNLITKLPVHTVYSDTSPSPRQETCEEALAGDGRGEEDRKKATQTQGHTTGSTAAKIVACSSCQSVDSTGQKQVPPSESQGLPSLESLTDNSH